MSDLADFLLARIAADEAFIRREGADPHPSDKARVLAECEAKRRILDLHYEPPTITAAFTSPVDGKDYPERVIENTNCKVCADGVGYLDNSFWDFPCDTIRALAAVYADHPDYREEWKP